MNHFRVSKRSCKMETVVLWRLCFLIASLMCLRTMALRTKRSESGADETMAKGVGSGADETMAKGVGSTVQSLVNMSNADVSANSGCVDISISGTDYQNAKEGLYTLMTSYTCTSRNVYYKNGNYIFYLSGSNWAGWMVGPNMCVDLAGIIAASNAITPDAVTSTWEEAYSLGWIRNSNIRVRCLAPGVHAGVHIMIVCLAMCLSHFL